jgi:hypothetical protein
MDEQDQARYYLEEACMRIGFPQEFGQALAQYLGSAAAMNDMAHYLVTDQPHTLEEAADEAVTIVQERSTWIDIQRSEHAQQTYNAFVNRPREDEDEDDDNDGDSDDAGDEWFRIS